MTIRLRTALFTPATRPERFNKAAEIGADVLLIDLEDSVALADKPAAREKALAALAAPGQPGTARALRINSIKTKEGLSDLLALIESAGRPDVLFLPKTESAVEANLVAGILARAEVDLRLIPLVESVKGLRALNEIAQANDRVIGLLFGAADLAADLGCDLDAANLIAARISLVEACSLAAIAPIDAPYFNIRDQDGLKRDAERARKLGFTGKAAVHPDQIPALRRIFSPSPESIANAREVLRINERGVGELNGQMIDEALARQARRVLASAE